MEQIHCIHINPMLYRSRLIYNNKYQALQWVPANMHTHTHTHRKETQLNMYQYLLSATMAEPTELIVPIAWNIFLFCYRHIEVRHIQKWRKKNKQKYQQQCNDTRFIWMEVSGKKIQPFGFYCTDNRVCCSIVKSRLLFFHCLLIPFLFFFFEHCIEKSSIHWYSFKPHTIHNI